VWLVLYLWNQDKVEASGEVNKKKDRYLACFALSSGFTT
jgi:hypothetical protein